MLHSPFSIHFCFPLGTAKFCFVSERLTTADPRTVRFDIILKFWATIVIQIFYILSEKSDQQSTLFESLSEHFCIHYFYVVTDSKKLIISRFPLLQAIPCRCVVFHVFCLLGLKIFGGQNENPCREPSVKSPSSLIMFFSVSSISSTIKDILFQKSTELEMEGRKNLRQGKRVFQSRDRANMNLVLAQSCNSNQDLSHYVPGLLQQHHIVLRVV